MKLIITIIDGTCIVVYSSSIVIDVDLVQMSNWPRSNELTSITTSIIRKTPIKFRVYVPF